MLERIGNMFTNKCVVDRGHKHSNGKTEICFWISEYAQRRPDNASPVLFGRACPDDAIVGNATPVLFDAAEDKASPVLFDQASATDATD
eukprot:10248518-Karenia_brevis.AAC.1